MAQKDNARSERQLAVTAIGESRPETLLQLSRDIVQRNCQILECRVAQIGSAQTLSLLITGNWSALGRLETALPKLAEKLDLRIQYRNDKKQDSTLTAYRPYAVEVIAPEQSNLLILILEFFESQNIVISELYAQNYLSSHTASAMCTLTFTVNIPTNQRPQAIRESFMDLCDDLNADGILDPIKN